MVSFNPDLKETHKGKYGLVPIGGIIAFVPGYFSSPVNSGLTAVGPDGTTAANANSYLNSDGWYVCDGAAINDSKSPTWNEANRHLPNLTDSRFIMGTTQAGSIGGNNDARSIAHTHSVTSNVSVASHTLVIGNIPQHSHSIDHNHGAESFNTAAFNRADAVVANSVNTTTAQTGKTAVQSVTSTSVAVSVDLANFTGSSGNAGSASPSPVTHSVTNGQVTSGGMSANSTLDILPKYLSVLYIIRVF